MYVPDRFCGTATWHCDAIRACVKLLDKTMEEEGAAFSAKTIA